MPLGIAHGDLAHIKSVGDEAPAGPDDEADAAIPASDAASGDIRGACQPNSVVIGSPGWFFPKKGFD
jgi:hypothetical protein